MPRLLAIDAAAPLSNIKPKNVSNPIPRGTLGDIGIFVNVDSTKSFPLALIIIPFELSNVRGIDASTIRIFRYDSFSQSTKPVWNSGTNLSYRFIWAKITQPGTYIPIGLPRDRLLQQLLLQMAKLRRYTDDSSLENMKQLTRHYVSFFTDAKEEELQQLRSSLATAELQTGLGPFLRHELNYGHGGRPLSFSLPKGASLEEFKNRLSQLESPQEGLPEENLFFKPEVVTEFKSLWTMHPKFENHLPPLAINLQPPANMMNSSISNPRSQGANGPQGPDARGAASPQISTTNPLVVPIPSDGSDNWWMYHGNPQHTGEYSRNSNIRTTTVSALKLRPLAIHVDGPILSIPCVVDNKIYVGSTGIASKLYKIDIKSGDVQFFPKPGQGGLDDPQVRGQLPRQGYFNGIGGSPAVSNGKVYFTTITGKVWCLNADTLDLVWATDLRFPDEPQRQPVKNVNPKAINQKEPWSGHADCWASPLVVNNKVYVGCGEGEGDVFGFVYCLDANSGRVVWLFCTCQFSDDKNVDNEPNVIPESVAGINPLPDGFKKLTDPKFKGVSIWSSCAYNEQLNRIYVGTGNTNIGDGTIPDAKYGSGLLSLDADTGEFKGFFQPEQKDNYRENDTDVDIGASPTLFMNNKQQWVVAIGSKNGSFFLLDADKLTREKGQQLLPKDENGAQLRGIDPHPRDMPNMTENMYGVFGTAAVHPGSGQIFVGLGGYDGAIDATTTPFMRALTWDTLEDSWRTEPDNIGGMIVRRYTFAKEPIGPMYKTLGEVGLSSPAVVNDLVFMSTNLPALYAFDVQTGVCKWKSPADDIKEPPTSYILGPAIYGDYVVFGTGHLLRGTPGGGNGSIYIYSL